jgi:8-oxo-dGTP pyrophosphatase MutT (NUDIX family)
MAGSVRVTLPPQLVEEARAFADGTREPAEPRNAATVVLMRSGSRLRSTDSGLELYLLRRQTSMAFAGGMCVFPGGGVDPRDFDHAVAWAGPRPDAWAAQLGTDEATARALVCAAVRETFEESGVLLAGESEDTVVADTTGEDWERDRAALETRELSLTDFLEKRRLVLRTDLLGVWAAWLTPVFEPRRYRTWFFVADLPEGQRTRDVSTESDTVTWLPAMQAVREVEEQRLLMLPPTYLTCLEVGQYDDPEAVLAAAQGRQVEMFTPQVEETDEGGVLTVPPDLEPLLESRS